MRGCIPVIMMDGVKSEFEEQLPLKEYALRIPMYMAFRTPAILKHLIESGRAAQMQVLYVWLGCGHTLCSMLLPCPIKAPPDVSTAAPRHSLSSPVCRRT